ncbi:MAG: universal stress protein [Nitriliruptoraceae bacterium]
MKRIVVGIDGSDNAVRALTWAADEAALHGAVLQVAHVYEHQPAWMAYAYGEGMSAAQVDAVRESIQASAHEAEEHARAVVDRVMSEAEIADTVKTESVVVEGSRPAEELVRLSQDADLLVVGSRGRGGFAGLLLGSVSQQCATHAACPVVIIRAEAA